MTERTPARALRLIEKAASADALDPQIVAIAKPEPRAGEAVVEVLAAAVNVSDAKAALGLMPQAIWPRTPGRDFAGRVVAGPAEWLNVEVWGTGGDLGITRDGSHARYLVLPVAALCRKPAAVSPAAAGTVGVPFITAFEGLRRAGLQAGQQVVVYGAGGKVGQAAMQLAARAGASVVGVDRSAGGSEPHRVLRDGPDLASRVMAATGGGGADIAFNTVGSPYFQAALDSLAIGGTQILISTIERPVPFDILPFYRRNLQMIGVDSLKLTVTQCARILEQLGPGFDDGSLRAFEVDDEALLALDEAADAYRRVLAGARDRVVLAP